MSKSNLIDKLDLEILKLLSRNSKISFSEISNILKVSNTTIHVRIKRLQKLGIIKNFTITIDYDKLGFNYTCYMGVYLDKASKYDQALKELLKIDNITGMDFTTGKSSLFCKIRAIDSNDARQIISKIHKIEGINRTETFFSLEQLLNQKESLLSKVINFATTGTARPNSKSEQDGEKFKSRYRYSGEVSENSREFCKKMLKANKLYRKEDIEQMSKNPKVNGEWSEKGKNTYDLFLFKGGGACRHVWKREIYAKKSDVNNPNAKEFTPAQTRKAGEIAPKNDKRVYQKPNDMPNNGFVNKKR